MNPFFTAAGILVIVIGLVHSVMGEQLIFRRMRTKGFIPTHGGGLLREPHVRILWASWHIVTMLGWCIAVALFWLAHPTQAQLSQSLVSQAIAGALLGSSVLVLVATKGRHLGWAGLLAAAVLVVMGMYA